ncbi:MAG: hypothetical protein D6755_02250 [Anaerolineae bacterium]|nr:MAG: hypothetical protein D6755_02250 [Anaerolineae bacterium]
MTFDILLFLLLIILVFFVEKGCFQATMQLLPLLTRSANRFEKFTLMHQKRGDFAEWAREHRKLLILDALFRRRGMILLLLVAWGLIPLKFSDSQSVMLLFYAVGLSIWPLLYFGAKRLSRLYAQALSSTE